MKMLLRICGALLLGAGAAGAADRLVIHEWGTFTSLEDENGTAIGGINTDDEPAPDFVHRLAWSILEPQALALAATKGLPGPGGTHPDVTIRLETPVLYVHAPAGFTGPLDVKVKFPGGWLTEFYPDAQADAPGIDLKKGDVGRLTTDTVGSLHWANLKIGGNRAGPKTREQVWLEPRKVAADNISTPSGESEKFLFYRGVGSGEPVLRIARDGDGLRALSTGNTPPLPFWLADIRPDGSVAYQRVGSSEKSRPFSQDDYSQLNLAALKAGLEDQLVGAGLYKDEAEALLNTWEVSYFKSPGLRAFCVVPQGDVDRLLPLTISPAADITRVMVGRIELVTPEERETMERIGDPNDSLDASMKLFFSLGRFRKALLLDEEDRNPNPWLNKFLSQYHIAYYQP
jgi:hypothetical protein